MNIKDLSFSDETRKALLAGSSKTATMVGYTYGALGNIVAFELELPTNGEFQINFSEPQRIRKFTKDGVTVARNIRLPEKVEDIAATVLIEAAQKTVELVGDGTTTTILLANELFHRASQFTPAQVRLLNELTPEVVKMFEDLAVRELTPKMIGGVALTSSNGDEEIAKLIEETASELGNDCTIMLNTWRNSHCSMDKIQGMLIPHGMPYASFTTINNSRSFDVENPSILLINDKVETFHELEPTLHHVFANDPNGKLIIIARGFQKHVLDDLHSNILAKGFKVCPVIVTCEDSEGEEIFEDLAAVTGGLVFGRHMTKTLFASQNVMDPDDLGWATSVSINKYRTVINPSPYLSEDIQKHREKLTVKIKETEDFDLRAAISQRLNRLESKLAILNIGGNLTSEIFERKDRAEDAILAVQSAVKLGVVAGGAMAYALTASKLLKKYPEGFKGDKAITNAVVESFGILFWMLHENLRSEAFNDKLSNAWIENESREMKDWIGCNLMSGELVNMFDQGIFDPAAVCSVSFKNAISAATVLLSTKGIIGDVKRDPFFGIEKPKK